MVERQEVIIVKSPKSEEHDLLKWSNIYIGPLTSKAKQKDAFKVFRYITYKVRQVFPFLTLLLFLLVLLTFIPLPSPQSRDHALPQTFFMLDAWCSTELGIFGYQVYALKWQNIKHKCITWLFRRGNNIDIQDKNNHKYMIKTEKSERVPLISKPYNIKQ